MMKKLTPRQINVQRKKDGKPPLNFRLLRRLVKKLETTPEAYDQDVWGRKDSSAPCGTAACIAGWTAQVGGILTLEQLRRNPKSVQRKSANLLGLFRSKYVTGEDEVLFSGDPWGAWPEPFGSRFNNATSDKQRARIAVFYLKHIIATGEIQ